MIFSSKKTLLVIGFLLIAITFVYLFYSTHKNQSVDEVALPENEIAQESLSTPPEVPDRSEYVKGVNEEAILQKQHHEIRKNITITQEIREAVDAGLAPLKAITDKQIKEVNFYGRVVDQYGNGVPYLKFRYSGTRSALSKGSGQNYTTTDENGFFSIHDARGKSLRIDQASKVGYQFPEQQYLWPEEWRRHYINNPYIIKAWKVEKYPPTKSGAPSLNFIPDSRTYTIDFKKYRSIKTEGETEGDLLIRMTRDESNFKLEMEAINGGVQVTDDAYRYEAPDTGYKNNLILEGDRKRGARKNLYFTSRNREIYGALSIIVRSNFKNHVGVSFDYIINLEQGRNLTIKK